MFSYCFYWWHHPTSNFSCSPSSFNGIFPSHALPSLAQFHMPLFCYVAVAHQQFQLYLFFLKPKPSIETVLVGLLKLQSQAQQGGLRVQLGGGGQCCAVCSLIKVPVQPEQRFFLCALPGQAVSLSVLELRLAPSREKTTTGSYGSAAESSVCHVQASCCEPAPACHTCAPTTTICLTLRRI